MTKTCIECGSEVWNSRSSLCQACFDRASDKKIDEDTFSKAMEVKADRPGYGWF